MIAICAVLLTAGVAGVVLWGGESFQHPKIDDADGRSVSVKVVLRGYISYVAVAVVSGLGAGFLIAGAGGRLIMRLLAATAGDAAQGRVTEADQIVGQISTDGTVGFIIFTGVFMGLLSGVIFVVIRRWLPSGRLGGLAFGVLSLVVVSTRIDPLRADNLDFDIVGPAWVAVTTFGALVVVHGMLVAALAARYSQAVANGSGKRLALRIYGPLLIFIPAFPGGAVVAVGGGLAVALKRPMFSSIVERLRSRNALIVGRVILVGTGVAALPGFISAVVDIV